MIGTPEGGLASVREVARRTLLRESGAMRQGLVEWAVVTAFLVLAAAGVSAVWRGEIRAAFGVGAPAAPALAPSDRSP